MKVAAVRSSASPIWSEGPRSLRAAIEADGPRIVDFEVSGVTGLGKQTLRLRNPSIARPRRRRASP